VVWILIIAFIVIAGAALSRSPSIRLWADKRPGRPGAVDPLGNPMHEPPEFRKPPDEGGLL
jgi:hypothetical protein